MRPRSLPGLAGMPLSPDDRRDIAKGLAIGAGVAVATELARFGLQEVQAWLARRREAARTGGAS